MPNIGSVLKQEITRLCRREIKKETSATRKASWTYRRDIAALKRKVAELERKATQLGKASGSNVKAAPAELSERQRFVAKGFRTLRRRLGLSAPQMAKLLDCSEQSVWNWETKKVTPRKEQFAKIIVLRGLGKREVQQRLENMAAPKKTPLKKTARKK